MDPARIGRFELRNAKRETCGVCPHQRLQGRSLLQLRLRGSEFNHLPIGHLLQWKAIQWLKANGVRRYELGLQFFAPNRTPRCPKRKCKSHSSSADSEDKQFPVPRRKILRRDLRPPGVGGTRSPIRPDRKLCRRPERVTISELANMNTGCAIAPSRKRAGSGSLSQPARVFKTSA